MKPFDLEAAKRGEPICNRDGDSCVFIAHVPGANPDHRAVALMPSEEVFAFNEEGSYYCDGDESRHDLFMVPKKRTVWVNLYPSGSSGEWFYESLSDANVAALENRIGNRAWPLEIEE